MHYYGEPFLNSTLSPSLTGALRDAVIKVRLLEQLGLVAAVAKNPGSGIGDDHD